MEPLNSHTEGSVFPSVQWNQVPSEIQNVITQTGQTLTSADLNQLGKGIAENVANGTFYLDSGVADAYVLTTVGSKQSITRLGAELDGLTAEFVAGNTNTGASTVNIATVGVKNIVGLSAGSIVAGNRITLKYRSGSDDFELIAVVGGGGIAVGHSKIETSAYATTTSIISYDGSIPQISEGALALTLPAYTPASTLNRLVVRAGSYLASNSASIGHAITAIFRDATLNAIVAGSHRKTAADQENITPLEKEFVAGSVTPTVFTLRFGPETAFSLGLNGDSGNKLGAASITWLSVTEYLP